MLWWGSELEVGYWCNEDNNKVQWAGQCSTEIVHGFIYLPDYGHGPIYPIMVT